MPIPPDQLTALTLEAAHIAREAGEYIRRQHRQFSPDDIETKGYHDYVSYVDRESERMIVSRLAALLPGSTFLAEEGSGQQGAGPYRWIIDPLDGTTNFIHRIPLFAVSIALEYRGELLIGIVYEVNRDELFSTSAGQATKLNGETVRVSTCEGLEGSLLATGFPYADYTCLEPYLQFMRFVMQNTRGLRRCGSAAVDLAYVACGRFDGFFEYGLRPWDVAAGTLLVRNAGGLVSGFLPGVDPVFGKQILAANKPIQPVMLHSLRQFFGEMKRCD